MQYHYSIEPDDCFRTALACVLDRPPQSIPNFAKGVIEPHTFHRRYREWLAQQGLGQMLLPWTGPLSSFLTYMQFAAPHAFWILGARPRHNQNAPFLEYHAFVARGGYVIHDPDPEGGGPAEQMGCQGIFLLAGTTDAAAMSAQRASGGHDAN